MRADDLAAPAADSFKFEKIGDTYDVTVTFVGERFDRINQFNGKNESVVKIIGRDQTGEERAIWPVVGGALAGAIAQAIRDAKVDELTVGGKLKVRYDKNVDTGKPQPMKAYRAKYEAPAITAAAFTDEEPF